MYFECASVGDDGVVQSEGTYWNLRGNVFNAHRYIVYTMYIHIYIHMQCLRGCLGGIEVCKHMLQAMILQYLIVFRQQVFIGTRRVVYRQPICRYGTRSESCMRWLQGVCKQVIYDRQIQVVSARCVTGHKKSTQTCSGDERLWPRFRVVLHVKTGGSHLR